MHNLESVLENEAHKLLWDFEIQADHLISTRRPDLIIINRKKENFQNCGPRCPSGPQKESERPRPCKGIEKTVEHESDGYTN